MLSKTHTKYIQNLSHKKFRDETGLFIAEGPKTVSDLLQCDKFICRELLALEDWIQVHSNQLKNNNTCTLTTVNEIELKKISALTAANQVLAVFEKANVVDKIETAGKLVLVLDTIQDPGNLGTIIRIADWFGIADIICSVGCADMYNPKVVQSTMGSLGRVNVLYVDLLTWLPANRKTKLFAASLEGSDVQSFGRLKEGMLIIGNEAHGISDELMALSDQQITIPRKGRAESLNAAVATGIMLSHLT